MAARFKVDAGLTEAFRGVTDGGPLVAYRVGIVDETFALLGTSLFEEPSAFEPAAFVGDAGCACYLLVQQPSRKQWTIVSYVPDAARIKDRMLYASGRESLKRELASSNFYPRDIHCSETAELADACFVEDDSAARRKEYQQGSATADIRRSSALLGEALSANPGGLVPRMRAATLTDSERLAQSELRTAAAEHATNININNGGGLGSLMSGSGSRKPTGSAVDFAATDEIKAALRALGGAEHGAVLVAIKAERLDVDGQLAEGTASALAVALKERDDSEPVFVLMRYTPKGAPTSVLVLFSFCPEGATVRKRMIHASAKPALRSVLADLELEVAKSVETQDLDDVTDEWLAERVLSSELHVEGPVLTKPAPKGGRRVMKREEEE
mmetsp:Transcript_4450/g.11386  ORF Transcript_4450/g.11386 Transcript_4450/m.11386 type:complete len:385 (+) Transcript_4450:44-1198(+)